MPFEIPDSWEWVRLKQISISELGKTLNKTKDKGDYHPYLCSINVYWNGISLSQVKEARFEKEEIQKYTLMKGDLLICEGGDVGRAAVWNEKKKMLYQNALHRVRFFCGVNPFFFQLLIEAYKGNGIIDDVSKGVTIKHLVQASLTSLLFPIPSIEEQNRIVEKLVSLDPLIKQYEKNETESAKLDHRFPDMLKKSILQMAVQGKLVPQDPNDEPASILLERIRAEKEKLIKAGKIKRDKHESVIYRRDNSHYEKLDGVERCIDAEIPFEIPEKWCWIRLKSALNIVSAKRVHQSDWRKEGVPFYRAREIGKLADQGYVDNELFISEELYREYSQNGVPKAGDLMVTAVGTLGKTYIVKKKDRFYYKDASVVCFENYGDIIPEYIQLIMMSPFMFEQIKDNSAGTTVGTITIIKANEYLIPLPPIKEQQEIVDRFKALVNHISFI